MNAAVVKRTQEALGKVIRRPPLTEKLLNKPPFRYLHDIITEVSAGPGRGSGCSPGFVGVGAGVPVRCLGAGWGSGPLWGSGCGPGVRALVGVGVRAGMRVGGHCRVVGRDQGWRQGGTSRR